MENEKYEKLIDEIITELQDEKKRYKYIGDKEKKLFFNNSFYIFKKHGTTFFIYDEGQMHPETWEEIFKKSNSCLININSI